MDELTSAREGETVVTTARAWNWAIGAACLEFWSKNPDK